MNFSSPVCYTFKSTIKNATFMKRKPFLKTIFAAIAVTVAASATATPVPDLKDLLSGGAIGNVVEGLFTKSDLTIADIAGEWTSKGSAVSFKSDNFLKKAGGAAAAGAVEAKIDPIFEKLGLTGAVLNIDKDGNFTLNIKKLPVKGTISVKEKGIFTFKFAVIGSMDAYVEKSPSGLNVMFDADKLKKIMTLAASVSGSKMVSAADQILQQYDGICIGFKMAQTGAPEGSTETNSQDSNPSDAVNALKGLFGK